MTHPNARLVAGLEPEPDQQVCAELASARRPDELPRDPRLDAILVELGCQSLRATREQLRSLRLLAHLSRTLKLVKRGESKSKWAVWLDVEVDGGRTISVDVDGTLEMHP